MHDDSSEEDMIDDYTDAQSDELSAQDGDSGMDGKYESSFVTSDSSGESEGGCP